MYKKIKKIKYKFFVYKYIFFQDSSKVKSFKESNCAWSSANELSTLSSVTAAADVVEEEEVLLLLFTMFGGIVNSAWDSVLTTRCFVCCWGAPSPNNFWSFDLADFPDEADREPRGSSSLGDDVAEDGLDVGIDPSRGSISSEILYSPSSSKSVVNSLDLIKIMSK